MPLSRNYFLHAGLIIPADMCRIRLKTFGAGPRLSMRRKIKNIGDVLGILSKTAAQDGYTIKYDVNKMGQKTTMKAKGPWNKLLSDLATKNRFVLVVKDKSVTVLP